jgi:hypothetical protein
MVDNLLDKASILLTPTAYDNGSMLSIKPENGDGDFTFSRAGNASRVNSSGDIVTESANIPRIDYTDGCGVWSLEGQSTNLYLNSETLSTQSNATSASTYTVSFYGTGTITFSGTHTGTLVGTAADERVSATFTTTSGTLTSTISGTCTKGQLENLPYATSSIPTNGASSTRLADQASGSGNSSLINSTEGVLYCDLKDYFRANLGGIGLYNQSGSAAYQIFYYGGNYDIYNGSSFIMDRSTIYPVESKIAVRWTSTAVTIFINGVDATKIGASLSANTPEVMNMYLYNNGYSKTKALAVYKEALTDAELQSLTTQ